MLEKKPSLNPFFSPKSILIIGASRNLYTFNGMVLKNLLESQYPGEIYIVHPLAKKLLGIDCDKSIETIIEKGHFPELAIILTKNDLDLNLDSLGQANIRYLLLQFDLSVDNQGFDQTKIMTLLDQHIQKYHFHVLGPSMIGIIDFQSKFTSSLIPVRSHIIQPNDSQRPQKGASFLAQSGGLAGACGWWSPTQRIPLAKVIHTGLSIGYTDADILEFLFEDLATEVILLFLRKISENIRLIIKRNAKKKPVLFKYIGKTPEAKLQLEKLGAMSVNSYIELFEFAKIFLWCPPPPNNGVGIIGPSSGAINLISAALADTPLKLAKLDSHHRDLILKSIGGSTKQTGNPIDYWPPTEFIGKQVCQVYFSGSKLLLQDTSVGVLVLALEFFSEIEFNFNIFEVIQHKFPDKPIIVVLIQAEKEGAKRILNIASSLHIPVFVDEVERAVRGLELLMNYETNRKKID